MKSFLTTTLLLASMLIASAQSLHILNGTTDVTNSYVIVPTTSGARNETDLSIQNTTAASFKFQINRTILNPPMNDSCSSLYFCTGVLCYPPNSSTTWTPSGSGTLIAPNSTLVGASGLSAHFELCPTICQDLYVLYRIYNTTANTTDTAKVVIKYSCDTGIKEEVMRSGFISDAYPNPANNQFSIAYQVNSAEKSEIVVYNLAGEKVKEVPLSEKSGILRIDTSLLAPGIYSYSLLINKQVVSTRKIMIAF